MKHLATASFLLLGTGLCMLPCIASADVLDCDSPSVTIESPEDGAQIEGSPAQVDVAVEVKPGGADTRLARVWVSVGETELASMDINGGGTFTLPIELQAGTHELVATAHDDCGGPGSSDPITLVVLGDATEEPTAGADDAGLDGGASNEDKGGCAVTRVPQRSLVGLSAFFLAVFGAWRLRRSDQNDA